MAASINILGDVAAGTGVITFTDLTFDISRPSDPVAIGLDGWVSTTDGSQDFAFLSGSPLQLDRNPVDFNGNDGVLNGAPALLDNTNTGTTDEFGSDGFSVGTTFFYLSFFDGAFEGVPKLGNNDGNGEFLTISSASYALPALANFNQEVSGYFVGNARLYNIAGLAVSENLAITAVPVPAAAWLFGSALIGLVGIKRKK